MVEHPVEGNEVISEQSVLREQQQAALGEGAVPADLVDQELLDRFVVNLLLRVARFDLFLGPMQVRLKEGQLVLEMVSWLTHSHSTRCSQIRSSR